MKSCFQFSRLGVNPLRIWKLWRRGGRFILNAYRRVKVEIILHRRDLGFNIAEFLG